RSVQHRFLFVVERLVTLIEERCRQRSKHVACTRLDNAAPPRGLIDVLVVDLLRKDVRKIVESHARARAATERLRDGTGELVTGFRRQGGARLFVPRLVLIEPVQAYVSG